MKIETLTKKWWFYAILMLIAFIPAYTAQRAAGRDAPLVVREVLMAPMTQAAPFAFPIAKALLLFLFLGPRLFRKRISRPWLLTVAGLLAAIAVFQNMSTESRFGFSVLAGNILAQLIVAYFWVREIPGAKGIEPAPGLSWWKICFLALSFLAFWMPHREGLFHMGLAELFLNDAALTYCMVTPIIICSALIFFPGRFTPALRVASFLGIYFGLMNMLTWFVLDAERWWMGVLHLPLLIISAAGFVIAIREGRSRGTHFTR